jgi:nucleotide-binding universal stress UspA family protein
MTAPIIVGVALRENDAAPLALARLLARLTGAPLLLVTVLPREAPVGFPSPEYASALRDEIAERLRDVARRLGDGASTRVLDGSPAGAMHELAEEINPAAVVVGSTHRGVVGRLLVGQVATGLLHGTGCPVAIAPRGYDGADGALQQIGVAFDGSPEARVALEAGIGLAGRAARWSATRFASRSTRSPSTRCRVSRSRRPRTCSRVGRKRRRRRGARRSRRDSRERRRSYMGRL